MKRCMYGYLVMVMMLGVLLFSKPVYAQNLYQTEFQASDPLGIFTQLTTSSNIEEVEIPMSLPEGIETPTGLPEEIQSEGDNETETPKVDKQEQKPTKQTTTCVLTKGMRETYYLNMDGKVRWSVNNKKIVKLEKKSNKKCVIKALKNGKATITAKTATQTLKIKVTVKSGDSFVNAWCKNWVKTNITNGMSQYDKVLLASYYMNVCYAYGQTSSVRDVIVNKKGTCVSGGRLLVKLLGKMGFKAELRFAAKDKMSRYPQGVYFASQHYNVKVKINKKYYYVDGTPATGFIYLSSSSKPLYCAFIFADGLMPVIDEIHK